MRVVTGLLERFRALLLRSREEAELDEELRFHVERQTEEYVRHGLGPKEARRRAILKLGGVGQTKEQVRRARGVRPLEAIARDARHAVRRLRREPGFTVPAVVTLAVGIGAAAAVLALVHAVLLRPLPYAEPDRLVAIQHVAPGAELSGDGLSRGIFQHYRQNQNALESLDIYIERVFSLTDDADAPERLEMAYVSPGLLETLGVTPHLGRLLGSPDAVGSDGTRPVVIAHDLWVRRYGADPDIIGRAIEIGRSPDYRIVGVAPPGFGFPDGRTRAWIAWDRGTSVAATRANVRDLHLAAVARLRAGVSVDAAQRDLARLLATLPDAYSDVTDDELRAMGFRADVVPLEKAVTGDVRASFTMLLGAAAVLLLIAWANVTNLWLLRTERAGREVAVQRALGASAADLARRFVTESLMLVGLAGALGLGLTYVAIATRFGFAPDAIPRLYGLRFDAGAIATVAALSLASAIVLIAVSWLGLRGPGLGLRGPGLAARLGQATGRASAGRRELTGRRLLVAVQVSLALTLLVGSALMARSFWNLSRTDLGFESRDRLTFALPVSPPAYPSYRAMAGVHDRLLQRLRALPGIDAVEAATTSGFPLTPTPSFYEERIAAADAASAMDDEDAPLARFGFATPGYFDAMGIPFLAGRTFRPEDTALEAPGVILSDGLARALFGDADPVGREVRWNRTSSYPDYTVVGVVGDVPGESVRDGPSRAIYFPNIFPPLAETVTGVLHIYIPSDEVYVLRTSRPLSAVAPEIRRAVRAVDSKLVLTRFGPLQRLVDASLAETRLTMLLLLVGAGTALLLGVVGIYGVLAYAVRRRRFELGVRIALGASPASIVRMVVRQGAALALAGIGVGLLAAWVLTRSLRALLYQVSPSDPVTFLGTAVLLFTVALLASYLPARRAGRVDPMTALKSE